MCNQKKKKKEPAQFTNSALPHTRQTLQRTYHDGAVQRQSKIALHPKPCTGKTPPNLSFHSSQQTEFFRLQEEYAAQTLIS